MKSIGYKIYKSSYTNKRKTVKKYYRISKIENMTHMTITFKSLTPFDKPESKPIDNNWEAFTQRIKLYNSNRLINN